VLTIQSSNIAQSSINQTSKDLKFSSKVQDCGWTSWDALYGLGIIFLIYLHILHRFYLQCLAQVNTPMLNYSMGVPCKIQGA